MSQTTIDYKLILRFSAVKGRESWPYLRILIDDTVCSEYHFTDNIANIKIPISSALNAGEHILSVERKGRVDNDDPQTVILDSILLDDIQLPDYFRFEGEFEFNNTKFPNIEVFQPNGVWRLKFEMPIIDWIINKNFEKNNVDTANLEQRRQKILEKLLSFEESIKLIVNKT